MTAEEGAFLMLCLILAIIIGAVISVVVVLIIEYRRERMEWKEGGRE